MEKKKFEYKWIILVLCVLMNFVCLGFCSSNKGMYLTAITEAWGMPRSLFSINDSCRFIASAVVNLFFGALIYRWGIRKMVAVGFPPPWPHMEPRWPQLAVMVLYPFSSLPAVMSIHSLAIRVMGFSCSSPTGISFIIVIQPFLIFQKIIMIKTIAYRVKPVLRTS